MIKEIQLQLLPSQAHSDIDIRTTINQALFIKKAQKMEYEIIKQSIDARGRNPKVILKVKVIQ
jgi:hypothetical protein